MREHKEAEKRRLAERRKPLDRARVAAMAAEIDKPTFTRADVVEIIGAQLPYDVADPHSVVENAADGVSLRVTAPRESHQREGHERFTIDAIMVEEERVFGMVDERDERAVLQVADEDVAGLAPDQERAIRNIAASPMLVQPLQAPAGAGKTFSLRALHTAARRSRKEVIVLAPTGKAVDEAMADGAGDRGETVAKALAMVERGELNIDRTTIVVVDEASMLGTPELRKLLSCAVVGRAKIVPVGDSYQLAPVLARGGMFDDLIAELPWAQHLSVVWRMSDPAERDMSLALRSAHGNRLRRAIGWYRKHGRLHVGDEIAMAIDARDAFVVGLRADRDALLMCDSWKMADAINVKLHNDLTVGASIPCARDQAVRVGDVIVSRSNDASIQVLPREGTSRRARVDQVRNGNRWRVAGLDTRTGKVAARRMSDGARVIFEGEYLAAHVSLGYAVTLQSAEGVTVDCAYTVLHENASRSKAYVGATRGRDLNQLFIYRSAGGEADHEHTRLVDDSKVYVPQRGTKWEAARALQIILTHDDRPRTMHTEADRTERDLLPGEVVELLERHDLRRAARRRMWLQYGTPTHQQGRSWTVEPQAAQVDPLHQTVHGMRGATRVRTASVCDVLALASAARDKAASQAAAVEDLRRDVAAGRGPAMRAAAAEIAAMRERVEAQRPYAQAAADLAARWADADADYEAAVAAFDAARDRLEAVKRLPDATTQLVEIASMQVRLAFERVPSISPAELFDPQVQELRNAWIAEFGDDGTISQADVDAFVASLAERDEQTLRAEAGILSTLRDELESVERELSRAWAKDPAGVAAFVAGHVHDIGEELKLLSAASYKATGQPLRIPASELAGLSAWTRQALGDIASSTFGVVPVTANSGQDLVLALNALSRAVQASGASVLRCSPLRRDDGDTVGGDELQHQWRSTRVYTYTRADGSPVQRVTRRECSCDGSVHKSFVQQYRVGREWVWRKPADFVPVLYRAPDLARADADEPVWLCEGEKDADTAARLGLFATTNAQGAINFPPELAAEFAGRRVVVAVDRDLSGYRRALRLHEVLRDVAADVRFVLPAVVAAKSDLSDHVEAGLWDASREFGGMHEVTPEAIALRVERERQVSERNRGQERSEPARDNVRGEDVLSLESALAAIGDGSYALTDDSLVIVEDAAAVRPQMLVDLVSRANDAGARLVLADTADAQWPVKPSSRALDLLRRVLPRSMMIGGPEVARGRVVEDLQPFIVQAQRLGADHVGAQIADMVSKYERVAQANRRAYGNYVGASWERDRERDRDRDSGRDYDLER